MYSFLQISQATTLTIYQYYNMECVEVVFKKRDSKNVLWLIKCTTKMIYLGGEAWFPVHQHPT